jgi:hypothetical protein
MALVKFSTRWQSQPGEIAPNHGLPGECKIRQRLQDAADPQTRRHREGARHVAAGKSSEQ